MTELLAAIAAVATILDFILELHKEVKTLKDDVKKGKSGRECPLAAFLKPRRP